MAVATIFAPEMTALTGNTGGAVQSLPNVTKVGARERVFVTTLVLATQVSTSVIGMARLPLGAIITGITLVTDTSLGSSTIALGDTNSAALYMAAQTLTSTNTPTRVGLASAHGAPITAGFDCVSGLANKSYEDIVLTIAVANFPASGNLTLIIEYALD
jgi:hypothetical protein